MWKAEHFCPKSGPAWEVMGMCKNFFLKKPRYVKKAYILFINLVLSSEILKDEEHNGIELDLNIREPVHYGLLHKMCRSCDWLDFTMFFHWLLSEHYDCWVNIAVVSANPLFTKRTQFAVNPERAVFSKTVAKCRHVTAQCCKQPWMCLYCQASEKQSHDCDCQNFIYESLSPLFQIGCNFDCLINDWPLRQVPLWFQTIKIFSPIFHINFFYIL